MPDSDKRKNKNLFLFGLMVQSLGCVLAIIALVVGLPLLSAMAGCVCVVGILMVAHA